MATLDNATTRSQCAAIREHLLTHGWIDKPTALRLCECERLASRINDLRNDKRDPMNIKTEYRTKLNKMGHTVRYGVYVLIEEAEE